MKKLFYFQRALKTFGIGAFSVVSLCTIFAPATSALTLKDWQYSTDSSNDSSGLVSGGGSGVGAGTNFEIYSTAVQEINGKTRFAIRSNLGLGGASSSDAADGRIYWGDLIINIACEALDQVSSDSLFGIRFAAGNESSVPQVGVYKDITIGDLAVKNGNPGSNLAEHSQWVINRNGNPQTGTLAASYFDETTHVPTLIKSGTLIGAVDIIADTSDWGLEGFNGLGGQTIAFEWDRNLIPTKQGQKVCYHLSPECNNDIHGGDYDVAVPTPAAVLPVLSGLFAAAKRKRKTEGTAELD